MPGDKAEEGIHNLFELDRSLGQPLSQAVDDSLSVLVKQWVGTERQSVEPLNSENFGAQPLDSLRRHGGGPVNVPYKQSYRISAQIPDNSSSLCKNYQLNSNGSLLGNNNFQTRQNQPGYLCEYTGYDQHNLTPRGLSILKSQQEYESGVDSPTLTANSERSEITEVSTDFSFLRGQQQFEKGHQLWIPQPSPMQQSGHTDMQSLQQQHMVFKQLQDFQRQQQLQQLGEVQQQNSLNQLSAISRQAPLNGAPVTDASQMLMNWVQCSASPAAQGVTNRVMFPTGQGQSLNGTPVAHARGNNMGQYSQGQGIPQVQKPAMQSSGFNYPFLRDQFTASPGQTPTTQGALFPSQGFLGKNMFGQVSTQDLNSGVSLGNLHEGNSPQTNASLRVNRQEQTGWSMQQNTIQRGPSQDLVPLDPIEEKLLYNMDDTVWDVPSGKHPDIGASNFGNALENIDASNTFPSMQSGSWSALMQSAVGEASSNDTGVQEEWSGLTFQHAEQTTDNQLSNIMESDNQQPTGWIDNSSLQAASSFSSKPLNMINDSSMNSFPGFPQPGVQFSNEQGRGVRRDGSHESVEKSPKVTGQWVDCKTQQKSSIHASQQIQSAVHLNNAWVDKVDDPSEGQQVPENNRSHNMGKGPQQLSNGPHVFDNSRGGGEVFEKPNSYFQRESTDSRNNSNELGNSEQGRTLQFQLLGDASSNNMILEQGLLTNFQGNSKASNELPSRGDINSLASDGSTVAAQARVDSSSEHGTMVHYGSTYNSSFANIPEAELRRPAAPMYQSPVSQSFGLGLASPSQRIQAPSHSLPSHASPQPLNYPNTRQVNYDMSQRAPWDVNVSDAREAASSCLNMQGNSRLGFSSGHPYARNQPAMQFMPSTPVISQSPQAQSPSTAGRYPHLNDGTSEDTSQQNLLNPLGQRFPVLESVPVSQPSTISGTSQQVEVSARQHNVWTNVPIQRQHSVLESPRIPSSFASSNIPSNNSLFNSPKGSYGSPEFGAGSQQQISSETQSPSQRPGSSHGPNLPPSHISESNILPSRSLAAHFHQVDRGVYNDSNASPASGRNLSLVGRAPDSSQNLQQNYSLLQQIQAIKMKNAETDPSKRAVQQFYNNDPRSGNHMASNRNLNLQTNFFQPREASEDQNEKIMTRPPLPEPSHEAVKFGQYDQSGTRNVVSDHTEHGQMNLPMAPSWMKQYGTVSNGQILPMYDAQRDKAVRQFSLGKPPLNSQTQAPLERANSAAVTQVSSVMPSTLVTSVEAAQLSLPYVLPSDGAYQDASITSLKKRKSLISDLPWHREVTEGCKRLHTMSVAEQDWAQATNRLVEKVEDEVEVIENANAIVRLKRRLILTTQLMQQVLDPVPASFLSADAARSYDSITYLISRTALRDACSLTCTREYLPVPLGNNNMILDKPKTSEGTGVKQLSEVVEELTARTKKVEDDFQRLDRSASLVDVRVECQDLERFSIINRFAKYHVRGQTDTSGSSTSSGSPKPFPQRYVTAHPMPRNIPESSQCISL